jgi:hypothetical protein
MDMTALYLARAILDALAPLALPAAAAAVFIGLLVLAEAPRWRQASP